MFVTVLDWDDTLLCTSEIHKAGGDFKLPVTYVDAVAQVLLETLRLCPSTTYIVSSSSQGWVEESTSFFAPALMPLISRCHVINLPKETRQLGIRQKEPLLAKVLSKYHFQCSASTMTVLLAGNMPGDVSPAIMLRTLLPRSVIKTCKLVEEPSVDQLEHELRALCASLESMLISPLLDFHLLAHDRLSTRGDSISEVDMDALLLPSGEEEKGDGVASDVDILLELADSHRLTA